MPLELIVDTSGTHRPDLAEVITGRKGELHTTVKDEPYRHVLRVTGGVRRAGSLGIPPLGCGRRRGLVKFQPEYVSVHQEKAETTGLK